MQPAAARGTASNRRELERFYRERLFANEVMLMPYYIASLNIEREFYDQQRALRSL